MLELVFIFLFLPISIVVYYFCGQRARQYVLFAMSLLFYYALTGKYVAILLFWGAICLVFGRCIFYLKNGTNEKLKKAVLVMGIVIELIPLVFCKYLENVSGVMDVERLVREGEKFLLPVGLSFYTFKAVSFLVDIYKGEIPNPTLINGINYLTFFGTIEAGPISRYNEMFPDITPDKALDNVSAGMVLFICGIGKKVLIANVLENIVSEAFISDISSVHGSLLWLGSIAYSLQLYFDFSGYSDMAAGVSRMFGYGCRNNFDYPYITKTMSEFWRRWHISLGKWFRDYVYIPCGGGRGSYPRVCLNLLIVWILTGIWHGADFSFIVWAGISYAFIIFEKGTDLVKKIKPVPAMIYRVFILFVINIEWIFFKSENLSYALSYLKNMFNFKAGMEWDARALFLCKDYLVFLLAALMFAMPVVPYIKSKCTSNWASVTYLTTTRIFLLLVFICSIAFLVAGGNNPFAYGNF